MDLRAFLLRREDAALKSKIDDLYWTFTRTAKGKPPVCMAPNLYVRRREIADALAELRRRARLV